MKLIAQTFETPVTEGFTWATNAIVSDDGTEQRISLLDPPIRTLEPTYNFTTEDDARALVRTMFRAQDGYQIPAFHRAVKVAPAAIGAGALVFDRAATELRDGALAAVYDRVSGSLAIVNVALVAGAGCTLAVPLAAAIGPRSMIAPLWAMVGSDNASLSRATLNTMASATISLRSLDFVDPFLNPANVSVLDTFGDFPILSQNAIGTQFDLAFNTGAGLIDYGAAVVLRSRWKHTQEQFARDFLMSRSDMETWYKWHAFFDYCKGSAKPFYMPTHRPDFAIVGVAADTTLTLEGLDYAQDYFPFEAFKQFSIFTRAGRHNASVTAVAQVGGNSVCTINPALPVDAGYAIGQVASLLLKCRIADDKVLLSHEPMQTIITLNMRTTDE